MAIADEDPSQSGDDPIRITVVTDERGSACWQACGGGYCVRSRCGVRVLELLAALLRSKGRRPPPVS